MRHNYYDRGTVFTDLYLAVVSGILLGLTLGFWTK